ncbi:hypothetical protein HY950_00295 [Candidatus Gottesmanbacteria bacterium]|nr:hypothetical protein [Candidatus Gottesmanbacteria bacterium]
MIILLHGDDRQSTRAALLALKKKFSHLDLRVLNGKTADENALVQAIESPSVFGGSTGIIIENLLTSLGKKPKTAEHMGDILKRSAESATIILWEEKEMSPSMIRHLGSHVEVNLFKIPAVIFSFLDAIRPSNTIQLLSLYGKTLEHSPAELIFTLLARRLRTLVQLSGGLTPTGMAPWQLTRLTKQARFFTMEQIFTMEKQLLACEFAVKTGSSALTLSQHIERILVDL